MVNQAFLEFTGDKVWVMRKWALQLGRRPLAVRAHRRVHEGQDQRQARRGRAGRGGQEHRGRGASGDGGGGERAAGGAQRHQGQGGAASLSDQRFATQTIYDDLHRYFFTLLSQQIANGAEVVSLERSLARVVARRFCGAPRRWGQLQRQ